MPFVFSLAGAGFLLTGLAGLLKAKWFPRAGMVMLIFGFICFNWIFIQYILPSTLNGRDILPSIGLLVMVYTLFFSFLLLFKNEYFQDALVREDGRFIGDDNILDAEDK